MPSGTSAKVSPAAKIALAVVLSAELMSVLDQSVVLNAIPTLQQSLGAGPAAVQWFTAGYGLALALGLITGGRLGDTYGRRRIFLIGAAAFTLASLLCSLAGEPGSLVTFRILQGAGAAIMLPQVLATIHVTFEGKHRSRAFGLYGGVLSLGSALGPVVGGVLIEADLFSLAWRTIFLINVPIGLIVIILGARYITESTSQEPERLDVGGMLLSALAVVLIVFPLTQGPVYDWPIWCFAMLAGGLLAIGGFIFHQQRRQYDSPLVVLALFRSRAFSGGLCAQLLSGLVTGMFFITWALYLQRGLDLTPIQSALAFTLITLGELVGVAVTVKTAGRFARRLPQTGALLAIAAFVAYGILTGSRGAEFTLLEMTVPLLAIGMAFGMIGGPLADLTLSHVPQANAGAASGLFNTSFHLGAALGTALTGVIFFSATGGSLGETTNQQAFTNVIWTVSAATVALWGLLFFLPARPKAPAE